MLAEVQFALQLAVVRGFGAREARHTMTLVPDAIGFVLVRTVSLRHANRLRTVCEPSKDMWDTYQA